MPLAWTCTREPIGGRESGSCIDHLAQVREGNLERRGPAVQDVGEHPDVGAAHMVGVGEAPGWDDEDDLAVPAHGAEANEGAGGGRGADHGINLPHAGPRCTESAADPAEGLGDRRLHLDVGLVLQELRHVLAVPLLVRVLPEGGGELGALIDGERVHEGGGGDEVDQPGDDVCLHGATIPQVWTICTGRESAGGGAPVGALDPTAAAHHPLEAGHGITAADHHDPLSVPRAVPDDGLSLLPGGPADGDVGVARVGAPVAAPGRPLAAGDGTQGEE
ncbi:MAG: hypothetical protein EBZ69_06210 [Alphaproteobacteria bacterium]|nr:hypothetical protein [Alphaproteobacteria bacterium]